MTEARSPRPAACTVLEGRAAIDLYRSKLDLNVQAIVSQVESLGQEIAELNALLRDIQSLAPAKNPTDGNPTDGC